MKPIALVLSIAAGLVVAQEARPGATVSGTVINSTNNESVRKAIIILAAQDEAKGTSYITESDGNGRFRIEDIEPGVYAISADREGFELETHGARGAPPPTLNVEAGQSIKDVRIRMIPLGVISGRVLDEDGDPVAGAQVQAMTYSYQSGKRQLQGSEQVLSNDKGEFRLFGLPPGTFYIRASGNGFPSNVSFISGGPMIQASRPEARLTSTFYPSTTDAAHATAIDLRAGAQLRGFDIQLRREMHYSIRGKLPFRQQEAKGRSLMLQIVPRGTVHDSFTSSLNMDDENFEFREVSPGSYIVMCAVMDGENHSSARQAVEVVNADVDGVTLSFLPPVELSGFVKIDGTPRQPMENLQVRLEPENSFLEQPSAEVKKDGTFVLAGVAPDVYHVIVAPDPGAYVKSIRLGDEEAPDGRIDLTKGSSSVMVLLGTDVGEVEGSVKKANGDPAIRTSVNLIACGSRLGRLDLSRFDFTDDEGKFHMKNVAPGEYMLFAWEDVPIGAPQDPEFRKPFEKQAVAVKMGPNGHETVELTAIPAKASQRP